MYTVAMSSLKLKRKVPVKRFDHLMVEFKDDGSFELLFMKFTKKGKAAEADLVAGIRVKNKAQWEEFKEFVDGDIRNSEG